MNGINTLKIGSTLLAATILQACGGSDTTTPNTSQNPDSQVRIGIFIDSPVEGIDFKTDTLHGKTNASGEFAYRDGESIEFSVGQIVLPATEAKAEITPLDLANTEDLSDTSATNILRLLQSLDSDSIPDNGITIDEITHTVLVDEPVDFSSDSFDEHPAIADSITLAGNTNIVSADDAVAHFGSTLIDRLALEDPKVVNNAEVTYYVADASNGYNGSTLVLGKNHFTLDHNGEVSAGKQDTSNAVWHLWNQRGRLHQFVYIQSNDEVMLKTCWSISPDLAAECGDTVEKLYLFNSEVLAESFNPQTMSVNYVVTDNTIEETSNVALKIESAELAQSSSTEATIAAAHAAEEQTLAEQAADNATLEVQLAEEELANQEAAETAAAVAKAEAEELVIVAAEQVTIEREAEHQAIMAEAAALAAQQEEAAKQAAADAQAAALAAEQAEAKQQAAELAAKTAAQEEQAAALATIEAKAQAEAARIEAEALLAAEEAAKQEATEKEAMQLAAAKATAEAQAAAQQAVEDEAEARRIAAEQAEADRLAAIQTEADRLAAEKAEADRLAAEKAEADRLAAEQAETDRIAAEQAEADRIAAEQAEADRIAAEQAEADRIAAEQAEADRIAAEQAEADRIAAEQAEADRIAAEQAEADRIAAEQAEADRITAEQAEADRIAAEQAEADRIAAEQAEAVVLHPTDISCGARPSDLREVIIRITNESRSQGRMCGSTQYNAAPALLWHESLAEAAHRHSLDMATHNFFSHTGSDGLKAVNRAQTAGFPAGYVGENIAAGQTDLDWTHTAWLESSGHCANIMRPEYTHIGAACVENLNATAKRYWTVVFGRVR